MKHRLALMPQDVALIRGRVLSSGLGNLATAEALGELTAVDVEVGYVAIAKTYIEPF